MYAEVKNENAESEKKATMRRGEKEMFRSSQHLACYTLLYDFTAVF